MNYDALLAPYRDRRVRVGLIGVGEFGATLIAQARAIPNLAITAVCDSTAPRAVTALLTGGYDRSAIVVCETAAEARIAVDQDRIAIVTDGLMIADLPLDIVVEATGDAEAAARNASAAIEAGKHVAMVTKEAESVAGPILQARAAEAGCVHTTVDGDQPSLLIGLVSWARLLGLDIAAAGKSSEYDFVFDPEAEAVTWTDRRVEAPGLAEVWSAPNDALLDAVGRRAEILSALPQRSVSDLCEMGIVANATGLLPDRPEFHAPILRVPEVPSVLCPASDGGLLQSQAALDVFNCLRRPDDVSFAGGVFVVVACTDQQSWEVLGGKGIPLARNGRHALLYNPQHLLGVEAPVSLLSAVLLREPTGATRSRPVTDVVARARVDLKAGDRLDVTDRHKRAVETLEPLLMPAAPAEPGKPIPYYMAVGARLTRDVPAGTLLNVDSVAEPPASTLWALRRAQDEMFFAEETETRLEA